MKRLKRNKSNKLSDQIKEHSKKKVKRKPEYDGDTGTVISTGSTLLDLAISGGRVRGGGIPLGILVEIFGPSSTGKTVLLSEIGGDVQRKGGEVMFLDPEARLNKQFARIFDLDTSEMTYECPDTVVEVFESVRDWGGEKDKKKCEFKAVMTDSLAALSTDAEMTDKDGMGMKRAKDFSVECRKTCRVLTKKNMLMVCSNQIRQKHNAGPFEEKYTTPGGEAVGFYASLRLRTSKPRKIKDKKKIGSKDVSVVVGTETLVEVYKSSVWKPYRTANVILSQDYGVDDIRANLQFIKDMTKQKQYTVNEEEIGKAIYDAIAYVEQNDLEEDLKNEVIDLWEEIELKFKVERKPKAR